jgi:hypothetical protein
MRLGKRSKKNTPEEITVSADRTIAANQNAEPPSIPSPDGTETKSTQPSTRKSTRLTYTNFDDDARYNAVSSHRVFLVHPQTKIQ